MQQFRNDVPPEIEQILHYMLASTPEYRYQDAYDVVNVLSHILMSYGITEHLSLISNFMGSLYPEAFQKHTGAPATRASMPAIVDEDLDLYNHNYDDEGKKPGDPDDFSDAPTEIADDASSYNNDNFLSHSAPTMPLDRDGVEAFFAAHGESDKPLANPILDLPPNSNSSPLANPDILERSTAPIEAQAQQRSSDIAPTSGRWKKVVAFLFLVLLGGSSAFAYLYYQKYIHVSPVVHAPAVNDTPPSLEIHVDPPQATVTLNGYPLTGKDHIRKEQDLRSGIKYRIRATLKGYKTLHRELELEGGKNHKLTLKLEPES
jgi:hypothetical protein